MIQGNPHALLLSSIPQPGDGAAFIRVGFKIAFIGKDQGLTIGAQDMANAIDRLRMRMSGAKPLFYCFLFYQRRIEVGEIRPLPPGRQDQLSGSKVRIETVEFVSDGNGNGGLQLHAGIILRMPGGF